MANNPSEGPSDDFFDQILGFPAYNGAEPNLAGNDAGAIPPAMMLQLNSGDGSSQFTGVGLGVGLGGGGVPWSWWGWFFSFRVEFRTKGKVGS